MEILSAAWLASLAAIVAIDLLVAGDNAVVISLAARSVAPHLRRRALALGIGAAFGVRIVMVTMVAWLLVVPGMRLAGGVALLWIAYKLLVPPTRPDDTKREFHDPMSGKSVSDTSFADADIAALRAIFAAALVMGTTNIVAIAGAAEGHGMLVAAGFLLSLPIVAWGAPMALRVMERFPFAVYVGAAVLAWTAVNLAAGEPSVGHVLAAMKPHRVALLYILVVGGVLFSGLVRTHQRFREYGLPAGIGTVLAIFIMTLMG